MAELNPVASHSPQTVVNLLDRVQAMFEEADTDGNKTLDLIEFQTLMKKFLPDATEEQMRDMFHDIDEDRSGTIRLAELLAGTFFQDFIMKSANMVDSMCQTERSQLVTQLQHAQQLNVQLQDHIDKVVKPATQRNLELEREIELLNEKLHASDTESALLKNEIASLQAANKTLEDENESLRECKEDMERRLQETTQEVTEEFDEISALRTRLAAEQDRVIDIRAQLKQMVTEADSTKKNSEKVLKKNDKLSAQNERLQARLVAMTEKYETQNEELQLWMKEALDLQQMWEDHQYMHDHDNPEDDVITGRARVQTRGVSYFDLFQGDDMTIQGPSMKNLQIDVGDDGGQYSLLHQLSHPEDRTEEEKLQKLRETAQKASETAQQFTQSLQAGTRYMSRKQVNNVDNPRNSMAREDMSKAISEQTTILQQALEAHFADFLAEFGDRLTQASSTITKELSAVIEDQTETLTELQGPKVSGIMDDDYPVSPRTPAPSNAEELVAKFGIETIVTEDTQRVPDPEPVPDQLRPVADVADLHMRQISADLNSLKQMLEQKESLDPFPVPTESLLGVDDFDRAVASLQSSLSNVQNQILEVKESTQTELSQLKRHLVSQAINAGPPDQTARLSTASTTEMEPEWARELAEEFSALKMDVHDTIKETIKTQMTNRRTMRAEPQSTFCGGGGGYSKMD